MHDRRKAGELLEVGGGEPIEHPMTFRRELQAHQAPIFSVAITVHEAGPLGSVDELDRAVVTEQQVAGDVADRWIVRPVVAAHGQEELMLLARQSRSGGLVLTPT